MRDALLVVLGLYLQLFAKRSLACLVSGHSVVNCLQGSQVQVFVEQIIVLSL
jgi:hypothetical protein